MPLHVSSAMCSSSGGQNCIIQHLVYLKLCTGRPPTGVMIPDAVYSDTSANEDNSFHNHIR